ncbi:MAG TPA: isoprenylcysteine carboxylmethyltransferase family protein [Terracidiphilus sp.]|nr:isoprenylcysteine carboxylmethyltransferase family protein [Terracidiphilus sp.]
MRHWIILLYESLFPAMWIAFLVYWQVMALNTKATQRMESAAFKATRVVLMLASIALVVFPRIPEPWLYKRLYGFPVAGFWIGAAITAAGLGFAVWARVHIGRNWSRSVTIKEGHELIRTGPYALVRHPIYTGILTGMVGSAIAIGQVRGALAVALMLASFWMKLRLEERWMRETFGAKYDDYARRVRALVPFVL